MSQYNNPFDDFPIEYKQINPDDFPEFQVGEKTTIKPNEEGYIKEELFSKIDFGEKNTVVINAAVGQGKTYSILEVIKKYYEADEDYLIFVASPFVSLIEQYHQKFLEREIPEKDIFRYELLGQKDIPNYLERKIHIVTVNCLLGNPGEDAFINSDVKRKYLQSLSNYCKKENKKVVFIYDEIHDAIHNFKEKYIFNLWKWKSVIHKKFIISATFNEASKVVTEYLAELTDDKIQIIESERTIFPEKQSDLYLHYSTSHHFNNKTQEIVGVIKDLVDRGKEIDILCFSKTLSLSIIENKEEGAGKLLYEKYSKINNCTSELVKNQRTERITPQNRYNPEMCNVGTNFKSGVSIEKDNHAFVIILPPNGTRMPFQNLYGIFTNGINSLIQALARQRKKGEIHIILPKPDKIDYQSLPFFKENKKLTYFGNWYEQVCDHQTSEQLVKYIPLDKQKEILFDFYHYDLKGNVKNEIELVEETDRKNKVRLNFPEYKLFVLDDGEDYLANKTPFFGGDLSAYVTYCAITNQFVNCKLESISIKSKIMLEEGKIQEILPLYYNMYYYEETHQSYYAYLNDSLYYQEMRKAIFKDNQIKIKIDSKWHPVKPNGTNKASKIFEAELINLARRYKGKAKKGADFPDGGYTRSEYLLDSLTHIQGIDKDSFPEPYKKKINAFQYLEKLKLRMIDSISALGVKDREIKYLPQIPFKNFIPENENEEFKEMLNYFTEEDPVLTLNGFSIKDRLKGKSIEKKKETFYKILLENLFKTEDYRIPTGKRIRVKEISSIIELPKKENTFDWISTPDYDFPDGFLVEDENLISELLKNKNN